MLQPKKQGNYFLLPNEIFNMDLTAGEIAVPSPKKQTKNLREKPNEKNDKYDIKLLYSTAFIPRFA